MSSVVYRLTSVHARIDDEICNESKRRFPNTLRLMRLKKLKLAIKDRLHMLMRRSRRPKAKA